MTKMKKILLTAAAVLAIGAMSATAYAASAYSTPAEAAAGLTGQTVEAVIAARKDTGKTYGEIASEAGVLDAFKTEMLQIKKAVLDEKVVTGVLTQEQADEIYAAIEEKTANCDGTGSSGLGLGYGIGFGFGSGNSATVRNESGACVGDCTRARDGSGNNGTCDGTCDGTGIPSGNAHRTGGQSGSGSRNGNQSSRGSK